MNSVLESLQFSAAGAVPGLVSVRGGAAPDRIEEQFTIRQAADLGDIDYVFFRRFSDGRSSQAAACVIDNSDDRLSENDIAKIHQRLWLNGSSPLLYVGWQTRVDVLSCARGPDSWKQSRAEYAPAETIFLTQQISLALEEKISRFSAYRLSDGTFWDAPENSAFAQSDKAAHQQLIRAVVETDREIEGHKHPVLRRLLLLTVLIKYLEDRGVFPNGWFKRFQAGATGFFDLLRTRPFRIGAPAINEFPSEIWERIAANRARNFRSWLKKELIGAGTEVIHRSISSRSALTFERAKRQVHDFQR